MSQNNRYRLRDGVGYTWTDGPWGSSLEIDNQRTVRTDHPFKVKLTGADKFKVVPGTVNNIQAKLGGTFLDATPRPEGTITETCYIYLECQHNAEEAFPVKVDVKKAATVPANSEEFMYVTLAHVTLTSGKATKDSQLITTSLSAEYFKCGSSAPEYFTSQT